MKGKIYYLWVSVITIAIIIYAFNIFTLFFFNNIETVAPNLIGMSAVEANVKYAVNNIKLESGGDDFSEYPEGVIFKQIPEAGKDIKNNSKIIIFISKGTKKIIVPDFTGMDIATARTEAEKAGIEITELSRTHHDFELEQVIASEPHKGSILENNNKVALLLSLKKSIKTIVMPDLLGLPVGQLQEKLTESGLILGEINETNNPDAENETIIDTNPAAGLNIPAGSVVNVIVNKIQ